MIRRPSFPAVPACLAAALAFSACARPARQPVAVRPGPSGSGPIEAAFVAKTISEARAAGAGEPTFVVTGAGAAGDSLGGRVALPDGRCALFLAAGSASIEDVDLFVYESDGSVLASDEAPRAEASALVCPPHPAWAYPYARIATGHGLVALSQQIVPTARAEAVAVAAGTRGPLHDTTVSREGWPGLDDLIASRRRAFGGSWHDVRRVAVPLDPRAPTRVTAPIEANQCLDALVLPGPELVLVDVSVLGPDGRILGRDGGEGRAPAMAVCSKAAAELTFELRPHAGRGLAAFSVSATSDIPTASGLRPIWYDPLPGKSLAEARAAAGALLSKDGLSAPRLVANATSVVGRRTSFDLALTRGCTRIDVIAGEPARGFDTWVWSKASSLVGRAEGLSSATLFACGPEQTARLDVEGVTRGGPFAVELRKGLPSHPSLVDHPLAAGRLLQRYATALRFPSPATPFTPELITVDATAIHATEVVVPEGKCADVVLALGGGAEGADLRLLDAASGDEIALAHGTQSSLASACAARGAGPLRVRIEARAGVGRTQALLARTTRDVPITVKVPRAGPPPAR